MKNAEKPLLSISLLTSNRMSTIPRCLESLNAIREAIPCELIIVDTSKNPEVHQLALSYTDNVEEFEWCNDFAKARNVGLKKAKGEWFMFIDDDEWFLDSKPLIDFFKSGEYKEYGYAHYRVRNYHDTSFKTYADGWVSRLVKIQEDTAFHSKIHEYLAPYTGKDKSLDALIGHSGYIYKTKEDRDKHFERNSSLLKKMEEEEPDNLRWKVQQIQEYRSIQDWEALEEYGRKTLEYLHKETRTVDLSDLLQIYIGYCIALLNVKKYKEVKLAYRNCKDMLDKTLLCKAYMDACMASACYSSKEYDEMEKYVLAYKEASQIYYKDPKKYEKEALKIILAETFREEKYCGVLSLLLDVKLEHGPKEYIYDAYPDLKWDNLNTRIHCSLDKKIINTLVELDDYTMLRMVLQDLLVSDVKRPHAMKSILEWQAKDETVFNTILNIVKSLDIEAWYKPYAALLTLEEDVDRNEVKEHAMSFINTAPNIFEVPNEILSVLKKYDIEIEEIYATIDFMKWKELLLDNIEYLSMERVDEIKSKLEESLLRNDIRFGYFMMVYSEQKLIKGVDEEVKIDLYEKYLIDFSEYTSKTYEAIFADKLREMELEDLPESYQAALWLRIFFEERNQDLKAALACLGKVAGTYALLANPIKYYLTLIKEKFL